MPCIIPLTISVDLTNTQHYSGLGIVSLTWSAATQNFHYVNGGIQVAFSYTSGCQVGPQVIASGSGTEVFGMTPSGSCGTFTINRNAAPHTFTVTVITGGTSYSSVALPNNLTINLTQTISFAGDGTIALSWNGSDYVGSGPNGLSVVYSIIGTPSADTCLINGQVNITDNVIVLPENYDVGQPDSNGTQQVIWNTDGVHYVTIHSPSGPPPSFGYAAFAPPVGRSGDTVIIYGTGFTCTTAVSFNGTPAISFTVVSDTEIIAAVPVGATTGPITVTTCNGAGTTPSPIYIIPSLIGPAIFHYS
jgi:hypothetical protein